jgi:cytochrome o ubiquinol oxidase subunit 3
MSSPAAGAIDHHHDPSTTTGIPNKKLLWWAFLASDCMFFGMLISTHLVYRINPPPGTHEPTQIFDIELTSFSTFILLMSSLMMALAVNAIQRGQVRSMRNSILTTIFFGCIFLGCQVYEFVHFVVDKKMTLTNSLFGSSFYTLTGTHGTHVAIGVLLLGLIYVRSFQSAAPGAGGWGEFGRTVLHVLAVCAAMALTFIVVVPAAISIVKGEIALGAFLSQHLASVGGLLAAIAVMVWFGRSRQPVDFGERNAIDVEAIGLYWHFVDIVWIVIFTAVYLLEYL